MRRSQLRRKKPLSRSGRPGSRTRTTSSRSKPRRSSRIRDKAYMERVRQLPCVLAADPFMPNCSGPVEAHHAGLRGVGQKSHDTETIPLCSSHHRQITDHTGVFKGWPRCCRRAWHFEQIKRTQAALGYTKESR